MLFHIVSNNFWSTVDGGNVKETIDVETVEEARDEANRIASKEKFGERVWVAGDNIQYIRRVTDVTQESFTRAGSPASFVGFRGAAAVSTPAPAAPPEKLQATVFEPGSVVELKSGGPSMVVEQIVECSIVAIAPSIAEVDQPRERLLCSWFKPSGEAAYGLFVPEAVAPSIVKREGTRGQ